MYVALSDLLTCPRCGPGYGLILLPTSVTDRRVRAGMLGCANCRERYPVVEWEADLRVSGGGVPGGGAWSGGEVEEPAVRLAALLGLADARGTVLVAGPAAAAAPALSALVEGVEVIAVGSTSASTADGAEGAEAPVPGVSYLRTSEVLPVRNGSMRAVALTGGWAPRVGEGSRVLAPLGHLVLEPAPAGARARVEAAGLEVVLEEGEVLVASRHA